MGGALSRDKSYIADSMYKSVGKRVLRFQSTIEGFHGYTVLRSVKSLPGHTFFHSVEDRSPRGEHLSLSMAQSKTVNDTSQ